MQDKKIYVGNLNYSVTDENLREIFSAYGTITDCVLIKDKYTNRSKGFGFVEFSNPEEAEKAISALDGKDNGGRQLKVSIANQKPPQRGNNRGRSNY